MLRLILGIHVRATLSAFMLALCLGSPLQASAGDSTSIGNPDVTFVNPNYANSSGTAASANTLCSTCQINGSQVVGTVSSANSASSITGTISGSQVSGAVASANSASSLTGSINGSQVNGAVASANNASSLSGTISGSQVNGAVGSAVNATNAASANGLASGATISAGQISGASCGVGSIYNLATQSCVTAGGIGTNQTWQDFTSLRVSGTTYTNTTGVPIQVAISAYDNSNNACVIVFYINGLEVNVASGGNNNESECSIDPIVPSGATYMASLHGLRLWAELR